MSTLSDTAPLGFLGGTFDPIHYAHLRLALEAGETLGLAQVGLIPAGSPPHRDTPQSTAADRLNMVRLATRDNPLLFVDDSEVLAAGKSYTVLTLERLRAHYGAERPLVWILGADAFNGLPRWHRWQELFALAHLAVANRPGYGPHERRWPSGLSDELAQACRHRLITDPAQLRNAPAGCVIPFDMTPLTISASLIRDLLKHQLNPQFLLPDSVLHYIQTNGLYRAPQRD